MAFTYSGNPAANPIDLLRFLVGDTVAGVALLGDQEILYLIATHGTAQAAVIPALRAMLRLCLHDTIVGADGITKDLRWRQDALKDQLREAEREQAYLALPAWGGTSKALRDARREETDYLQPAFTTPATARQRTLDDVEDWD